MENVQSGILLILVTILEGNLISLHRPRGILKLLTNLPHFTNHSPSCNDLVFTSNLSVIVDSGIEKSLCSSCNHDIIYGKSYFRVPFAPPHFKTI